MRKITNKAVSVILVMALCVSTLWGALIPASAATAGTYLIETDAVASGSKVITYEVTLTNPSGLTSGSFDLMLGKDVIDDVNFDANGNYIDPVNETLEDFRGAKQETDKVTPTFDWDKIDTNTATQWSTSDPDGSALVWQSTGNTRTNDNWVKVDGSTQYATSDPDGSALAWQATGNSKTTDNWTESTVNLKLSEVPADTATVKYVQGAKVQDNWSNTSTATKYIKNSISSGTAVTTAQTGYTISGSWSKEATESGTVPAATSTTRWVATGNTESVGGILGFGGTTYYEVQEQTNDPTYTYTKRVNTPVTTYEYQQYQNKPVTETEYAKHVITYYDYTGGRDEDGNKMINGTNVYKTVDVYDEDGNKTGTKDVVDYVIKENEGNKGTLLPNVFDGTIGLYDTKIEITGGTRVNDNGFSLSDFSNGNFDGMIDADNKATQAIEGSQTIDGVDYKYVYNMTDNYKLTHLNSNPVTYEKVTDAEGNEKYYAIQDINLLDKYYREYTTVDVATANLGYKISTVSEDNVSSTYAYTQYAQGFKDVTFNSSAAYSSITFTVTLDFSGNCDRSGANAGVDEDKLTTVVNGTNCRNTDGHWAGENYVQYDKKYVLNFLSDDAALSTYTAEQSGSGVNYAHVHEGTIEEETGLADPLNKEAIDALLAKNPNAKEGVDYFELYDAKCTKCGQVTPMIAAPDLPYKVTETDENGNSVTVNAKGTKGRFGFNNFRNISGISLNYNNNGTVSLNIHYPSKIDGEQMIITDENGMVLKFSDTIEMANDNTSIYESVPSNYAGKKVVVDEEEINRYEGYLRYESQMISIDNLSAKEVDQTLYIARYTPATSTETQLMGITHAISIADYCSEVIKGNNVYYLEDENYNESTIAQDKAVAAAFINYAHASKNSLAVNTNDYVERTVDLLEFGDYLKEMGSTSVWYDTKVADNGETGASWDDPIIIDSAEELVYLCKGSGNETDGKYYKVADNIAGFNLATDKLDINGTLTGESLTSGKTNLDIVKGSGKNHAGNPPGFQGHFDGNGAVVYGAWTNHTSISPYAGLFSCVQGDVTIKNINVKLASFTATTAAGGIVGYYKGEGNYTNNTTLTIENCSVTDSHFEVTGTGYGTGVGAIVGRVNPASSYTDTKDEDKDGSTTDTVYVNNKINVTNCFVNLDEAYFTSPREDSTTVDQTCHGGVVGVAGSNALMVSNCIVIGVTPYSTTEYTSGNDIQHTGLASHFSNIYTDQATGSVVIGGKTDWSGHTQNFTGKVYQLTTDQLTGLTASANMPKLDWYKTWCATEGYPTLYAPYNIPDVNKTIYWDGSTATGISEGSGTKDDPYIINTVAELAWVVSRPLANFADTDGKYFKVSDDIGSIVLQKEAHAAIMDLNSAAETKAYFESASDLLTWKIGTWEGTTFCGNIDFNGATIYGLYQNSETNAALFCNVDAGAVIKNLTLKNSYLTRSTDTNYQVGAIAAVANGSSYGKATNGVICFDGITVTNNYIYNPYGVETNTGSNDRSGIIMGASPSDAVYIDNCLVYGNDASWGAERNIMPLIASAGNSVPSTAVAPEGLDAVIDHTDDGKHLYFSMIRNCVALGCDPYDVTQNSGSRYNDARSYKNVYTDQQAGAVTFPNEVLKFTTAQIKHVEATDLYGSGAKTQMSGLDWYDAMTNPNGVWYFGYNTAMPSLSEIEDTMPSELLAAYNNIQFAADTLGTGTEMNGPNGTMSFGVYKTALSLKANPYMSFAFAFHGDYKTNRDKIKVRFTYTQEGATKTTEEISVPAYTGADIKNVDGWTNTEKNGRYHTYKADQIPVEAMADGIKVEASYNGGEWKDLGTFSVAGIGNQFETAYSETPCEYYATRVEAAKAFLFYVQQIKARYYNA